MIIVSQNKELITNLDNVIGIQKDGKRIGAVFVNGDSLILAEYKTEERAKGILQEIVEAIKGKSKVTMTQEEITTESFGRILWNARGLAYEISRTKRTM